MKHFLTAIKGWKLPFIALIAFIFAVLSVINRPAAPAAEPYAPPPANPYTASIAGIGVVEPASELITLGTDIPGIIRKLYVTPGEQVKAGDKIFALDMREINATIIQARAALATARIQAEDYNAQFALVKDISGNKAVAKEDFNRRKFNSQLGQARVAEAEAQLAQALITQERLTVKAPIDGQILEVNIRPGEFAAAGNSPLIVMGNTNPLHIRVEVDEENAAHITGDKPATALPRGDATQKIPLTFVRIEPLIHPKENLAVAGQRIDTRVMQVIYALPKDAKILVGQQMDVFIDREKDK